MRIAYFTDCYIPQVNGVTFSIHSLVTKLVQKGHDVRIYAPSYGVQEDRRASISNDQVIERYFSLPLPTFKEVRITLPNLYRVLWSIRSFSPDIIHFHSPGTMGLLAIVCSKLLHIPLIGTYHTLFSEQLMYLNPFKSDRVRRIKANETLPKKIIWNTVNYVYSFCDLIISPSAFLRDELRKRKTKKEIEVVSNGIDISAFSIKDFSSPGFRLLHVGRIGYEKNIDVVIEAFKIISLHFPSVTLTIVGDGPDMKYLKNISRMFRLGRKVSFTGKIPREKLSKIYRSHDIFITASTMEIQPLVVLEAMASGLPIVGVKRYGLVDLVQNEFNGYLVEPYAPEEIAHYALRILNDSKLARRLGRNSRMMAEENDIQISVDKLVSIYQKYSSKNPHKDRLLSKLNVYQL